MMISEHVAAGVLFVASIGVIISDDARPPLTGSYAGILTGSDFDNFHTVAELDTLKVQNLVDSSRSAYMSDLNLSLELNDGQDPDLKSITHENFARIYLATGDYESAIGHASRSLELSREFGSKLGKQEGYRLLSEVYSRRGEFEMALTYHQKLLDIRDRIFNEEKTAHIENLRTRYEAEQREAEIALLEQQRRQDRIVRNASAAGLLMLAIIAFLIFNRQKMKFTKNTMDLENRRLKEQQLEQELAIKNKQLTTYSLHLVQKNELMYKLKEELRRIRGSNGQNIYHKLQSLDNLVGYSFNLDEDWGKFRHYFEDVHTGFFELLKSRYPDLTSNDLRLCALIKLNLSAKEIASLLGISPSSVKIARYRLRKKLQLTTDQNLTAFLIKTETNVMEDR